MSSAPVYKRVPISALKKRRRGKHHDLMGGILQELETLPDSSAIQIPIKDIGGISLSNLRSAVHRATMSRGLQVETASDADHLYVWRPSRANGKRKRG
jgi:hypothetical protein